MSATPYSLPDRPRWMLVALTRPQQPVGLSDAIMAGLSDTARVAVEGWAGLVPHLMAITEDCEAAALSRGWIILAKESDIFVERI